MFFLSTIELSSPFLNQCSPCFDLCYFIFFNEPHNQKQKRTLCPFEEIKADSTNLLLAMPDLHLLDLRLFDWPK